MMHGRMCSLPAIPFRLPYRSPILAPAVLRSGGDEGTRTPDICFAKAALSQLSYIPVLAFNRPYLRSEALPEG